jgi:hypothetical protein
MPGHIDAALIVAKDVVKERLFAGEDSINLE